MVERFLSQTSFVSQEDYRKNLHIRVPENFNFGYDVVDAYAAEQPGKEALLWTDDQGAEIRFTFADIKRESDRTASSSSAATSSGSRFWRCTSWARW